MLSAKCCNIWSYLLLSDAKDDSGDGTRSLSMEFSREQKELLLDLALQQQAAGGSDFALVRAPSGGLLVYANGKTVPCERPNEDFYHLQMADLIKFSPKSNGDFRGRVTQQGIRASFGVPTGKAVDNSFPAGLMPKGTRAYEILSELHVWTKEHSAFFEAEMLESMPKESAPAEEFVEFGLKTLAGTFDIWVRAFSRGALLTEETNKAFEQLLDRFENLLVERASGTRPIYIDRKIWLSEVKGRLRARKKYWIGHRLRAIREQREQADAGTPKAEQQPTATPQAAAQATPDPAEVLGTEDSASATSVPAPGAPASPIQRKPGPQPNYELANQVAELVRNIAGDEPWPPKLDDICEALDDQKIPRPKTWKTRGYSSWCAAGVAERSLVVKAITHHLELSKVDHTTLG